MLVIPHLKPVTLANDDSSSARNSPSSRHRGRRAHNGACPPAQRSRPLRGGRGGDNLLILGETTFRKQHQRFGILPEDRLRHLWILGKTGSGKSTLLANLLAQDLERWHGTALLDPHGSLVETALAMVPKERTNEVLLFEPSDESHPLSFNVFRRGRKQVENTALLTSELVSVFRKQWAEFWGPRLEHVLRNAILAVAGSPRANLLHLYRFLTDERLRERETGRVEDPVVKTFWTKEFPSYKAALQAEALAPVLNKLGAFVSNPIVRNIVGQERSRVDLVELMNKRGILLANLSTGKIGEDASHLLGGLLLSALQLAAHARGTSTPPFHLYVDEFQHFATDSLSTMLSESRKYGLGLTLAHQYLSQLPNKLRDAVLGNVGSRMLFRVGAQDAEVLEGEFAPVFSARDLQELGRYHVATRLLVHGQELQPFSARTIPPTPFRRDRAHVERIREQSRRRYCSPR